MTQQEFLTRIAIRGIRRDPIAHLSRGMGGTADWLADILESGLMELTWKGGAMSVTVKGEIEKALMYLGALEEREESVKKACIHLRTAREILLEVTVGIEKVKQEMSEPKKQ